MIRSSSMLALLGAAAVLAACGSSKSSSTSSRSTSTAPSSTPTTSAGAGTPSAKSSKAAAIAAAKKINLHVADLPGASGSPNPTTGGLDAQLSSCVGTAPPGAAIIDLNSPNLGLGSGLDEVSYASNVKVMPTTAIVRNDLAAIKSAKARSCIKSLLPQAISKSGSSQIKVGSVRIAPIETSYRSPIDGSFGYRLTISASAAGRSISIVVDDFGISSGRLEVSLSDFGIGKPVPATTEQRLLQLLAKRAVEHRL